MLGLRYDSADGRALAARIAEVMRDAAYTASVELAKDKGVGSRMAFSMPGSCRSALMRSRVAP